MVNQQSALAPDPHQERAFSGLAIAECVRKVERQKHGKMNPYERGRRGKEQRI